MFLSERFSKAAIFFLFLCSIIPALTVGAAVDSRFELDQKSLGVAAPSGEKTKAVKPSKKQPVKVTAKSISVASAGNGIVHVVAPGDNLFKILMRDYKFSNDEAEKAIKVICRENSISDIRRLKVGQKIVIPSSRRTSVKSGRNLQSGSPHKEVRKASGMALRLNSADTEIPEREAFTQVSKTWDRIIPHLASGQKADMIKAANYSLTFDPQRYPVFADMAGGSILVDKNDSIPPLVKNLIIEKNPAVRIISESPLNGKRFLSTLLDSAGFYSVEKDFSIEFGSDPKLTFYADFKIEKSPESLINQDMILMNSGPISTPAVLHEFLKKEGFTLYEPFISRETSSPAVRGKIFQITPRNQIEIIDSLLTSMAIAPLRDKIIDVFAADDNGISLSVKAERYFERGGQRHVITRFDGDPIVYTLFRILAAKGYKTVILEGRDDFRKVTEKLLSSMSITGKYDKHKIGPGPGDSYFFKMSGFRLEGTGFPAAGLFLTDLELDNDVGRLFHESGYSIISE